MKRIWQAIESAFCRHTQEIVKVDGTRMYVQCVSCLSCTRGIMVGSEGIYA